MEPAQKPADDLHPAARPATKDLTYVVFRFHRALSRAVETIALRNGLTMPEMVTCLVLAEGRSLSNAQLARRTFVTSQACHEVVGSLLARGLVDRENHQTNKRIRLVFLSESGWSVMQACRAELDDIEQRVLARHSPEEREALLPSLLLAAETLAGGYFGDDAAESEALELRGQFKGTS
ncbi:MarR family winged helix-turn-helix transcriptional regulator [Arthrobacter sp. W4I7]|uniref:MarR family winged helix-turn-helix transcriptional regulator n=1 Tax=Arthrobacter sp. W4I7 TaxID=3042296 RepID=UPI0027824CE8|nr:MarR family transcriptional regulator [Arthrobacter sp. W4I7]MDQ0693087.1 DNA-binding MarR family transcriptional regulator [Arthrobacter sp. W4I7]